MGADPPGIAAGADVAASHEEVFAFLSRLENRWRLADRWIEVLSLNGGGRSDSADGGRVRIRGPLGLGRTASTRVVSSDPPRSVTGIAEVGRRSRATVRWTLSEGTGDDGGAATHVRLSAHVDRAWPFDRLLLALGGRAWMRRRFRYVLATLGQRLGDRERAAAGGRQPVQPVAPRQ